MKLLVDETGTYLLSAIASIHPVPIRGEARDQSKVTAVHTSIITMGGHQHNTAIPYEKAQQLFHNYHGEAPPPPA